METVAIVGVGLIGGSLGLALKKAGFPGAILGVSSERSIAAALERGAIDEGVSLEDAAARADVVYLAQPISGILATLEKLKPLVRSGTLITDAGSTKAEIVRRAEGLRGGQFLGGHPMAGKAARGVEESDADLFRDRTYVLTPQEKHEVTAPAARTFIGWIEQVGARITLLTPEEHDRIVALTSHLPQLVSTALASLLVGAIDAERLTVSGPGLVDMTRLALSSYEVWGDILSTNRSAIDHALTVYIDKLTEVRHNLQTQGLGQDFRIAANMASRLRR